ncbi:hypothetical protein SO694_00008359 [Aureococcus anophagefferens]|uniref:Uncharacterized protein n=1 Tax=Aureococcus anophagefferens TaxID=44056 RepID=A0ABR1GDT0_AURAN
MDSNDALMQQDVTDAAQEEPDAAPDTPRSDHSLSIDPPSDPEPQPWRAPWTQLRCFYGRLGGAFGWRYVATVSLTYGVNQGVGEALLFGAQKYFFLGDLGLSAAREPARRLLQHPQRSAVFRCAGATCATSLAIGNLQAFYRRDDADAVVGSLTVGLGLCLSLFIFSGLKAISRDLASAAVFIFLSGALSPATEVMFAWFHDDEKDDGNCAKRCAEGDEDCGWAGTRLPVHRQPGGPDDDADDDDGPAALELVGTDSAEERALV